MLIFHLFSFVFLVFSISKILIQLYVYRYVYGILLAFCFHISFNETFLVSSALPHASSFLILVLFMLLIKMSRNWKYIQITCLYLPVNNNNTYKQIYMQHAMCLWWSQFLKLVALMLETWLLQLVALNNQFRPNSNKMEKYYW